jgi:hypothetical protein
MGTGGDDGRGGGNGKEGDGDDGTTGGPERTDSEPGDPLEGNVLLVAAAKGSVSPSKLPGLVDVVQSHLGPQLDRYRREYEAVYDDERMVVFFVEDGHWDDLGEELGFAEREIAAVERGHTEQLRALGREGDRLDEFETALDIREVVVVGR